MTEYVDVSLLLMFFSHSWTSLFHVIPFLSLLQRFRKEDKQLSGTYAYARRSAALQKVRTHFMFTWLV